MTEALFSSPKIYQMIVDDITHLHQAMDDYEQATFPPRKVESWYDRTINVMMLRHMDENNQVDLHRPWRTAPWMVINFKNSSLPKVVVESLYDVRCFTAFHGMASDFSRFKVLDKTFAPRSSTEWYCIFHGIIHSYDFAKWCSTQPDITSNPNARKSISNSLVMFDDLNYVTEEMYCIWYP
ncbi:hypothetical protein H4R26_002062, partial [Coemansia thaxteri]